MPGPQPKKMLILNILQILKDYTDSTNQEHRLTQKEIMEHLERDYDNAKSMDRYPSFYLYHSGQKKSICKSKWRLRWNRWKTST